MKVIVYNLEVDPFRPLQHEIHVLGDDHGDWLAFETDGWNGQRHDTLIEAAMWYASYLDYPEIILTDDDPRPPIKLRRLH